MTGFLGDGFILRLYQTGGGGPSRSNAHTNLFLIRRRALLRGFKIIITPRLNDNIIVNNAHNHDHLLIRSSRLIAFCFPTTSLVRSYITGTYYIRMYYYYVEGGDCKHDIIERKLYFTRRSATRGNGN